MKTNTYGTRAVGARLPQGEILGRTYTAYRVRCADGSEAFVPFAHVDKTTPVEPLVRLVG